MENLKPNEQRGKIAVAMIWIMLALYVLMGLSNYFEYRLLSSWDEGAVVSMEAAEANDSRQLLIAILLIAAHIVSIILFIMWFRRAYYNLHLRVSRLEYSEGWAAGAWFVPIVNLYMPYQIMKELYTETFALLGNKKGEYPENFTTAYVGWWWTLWIVNTIIGRIEFAVASGAETLPESIGAARLSTISSVVGIPLALIAIKVITDYINIEKMLIQQDSNTIPAEESSQPSENQDNATEIVVTEPLL